MPSINRLLPALLAALAAGCTSPLEFPRVALSGSTWPDECRSAQGYAEFRAQLQDAVTRRDPVALKAMIGPKGAIRLQGMQMGSTAEQWRGASGALAWREMERVLSLGCGVSKDRLIFPYIATFAKGGPVSEENVIALRPTVIRNAPSPTARVVHKVKIASVLDQLGPDESGRWMRVILPGGQIGFVPDEDVGSAFGTVIIAKREDGVWRIEWIGGYD